MRGGFLSGVEATARAFARSLRLDVGGAIAPMGAGVMMLLALLGFSAVEFSRYVGVRSSVQDALDAAGLAIAKSSSSDPAQLQSLGESVMRSNMKFDANVRLTTFTVSLVNGRIVTNATVSLSPIVSDLLFTNDLRVTGRSEVLREVWGLEVALVLDNTGSMATNDRIGIAKTAAENFVLAMEGVAATSSNPQAVKIGVVPFAATVNVGPQNAGAAWMDTGALSSIHDDVFTNTRGQPTTANRFTLLTQMGVPWAGCVESRPMPLDILDTAPSATNPDSFFVPYFAPDEPDQVLDPSSFNSSQGQWNSVGPIQSHLYPNNYIFDIGAGIYGYSTTTNRMGLPWLDFGITSWGPTVATAFMTHAGGARGVQGNSAKYLAANVDAAIAVGMPNPRTSRDVGPNRDCKVAPITPLTDNGDTVITAIRAMSVGGFTNIPMGLVWGWHLVSPNAPFTGLPYEQRGNTKIIVLMTDGENSLQVHDAPNANRSDYSGVGYSWQNRIGTTTGANGAALTTALNNRLAALCTNVKNSGVVLYTVRLEMTGPNTMLQTCATDATKAFDVTNAAALNATFQKIAKSIQNLRVAK